MKKEPPIPLALPAIFWLIGLLLAALLQLPIFLLFIFLLITIMLYFYRKIRVLVLLLAILFTAWLRTSIESIFPENHISNVLTQNDPIIQPINGKIVSEIIEKKGR